MTSRRSILLLGSTALSIYLSFSFSFKQQLRFLVIALGINVIVCFIFGLLLPKYGIMHDVHAGAWRGVHSHKNKLGSQMALTTVFLLTTQYSHLFKRRASLWITGVMLLSAFMVVASKSTTGLLTTAAMALTFLICNTLRLSYRYMVIGVSSIVLILGAVSIYIQSEADAILGIFGKTTGLSGRDEIWPGIWHMISLRPFLGYGYEGFWGTAGGPADLLRQIVGWPAPNAHNGFLEILLAVGWIGGIFFFASFLVTTVKSFQLVRMSKQSYAIYPVLILVFLVLGNMTESNFFNHDVWILYVWVSLSSIQISDTSLKERAKSIEVSNASERASPFYPS
ncbi:O-antigen ligase family protein [Leptothoe sp. PORK10 BA2]|uniref:O-antigen ligase family protein n=1 Tax=Leptothoe sp. PORK10 BA2 TaxID=3110254 RepID=UPI002B2059C5|nr:O-antigen ligase [Leptothoe sp. PORK10 BA2]MEA5466981.1 O-antigen ligase [Leptothoe sp. PORK10 BA2]